jgi:hypothetical protein
MKLAIVLFFLMVPLKLEPFVSIEQQFAGSEMFDKYIAMEQDVTRVEQEFQKHLFVPKQKNWPVYTLMDSEVPVIKKDTWTPWEDRKFPIGNDDMRRERPSAVLPSSISFPDVKKRLLETLLVRRNGRKEELISDGYS